MREKETLQDNFAVFIIYTDVSERKEEWNILWCGIVKLRQGRRTPSHFSIFH